MLESNIVVRIVWFTVVVLWLQLWNLLNDPRMCTKFGTDSWSCFPPTASTHIHTHMFTHCFIFPPHPASVNTNWQKRKPTNYLNASCCFTYTQNTLKYHLVTVKTIKCIHQTGPIGTIFERWGMSPTRSMFTKSITVFVAVSDMGVVFHQAWSEN